MLSEGEVLFLGQNASFKGLIFYDKSGNINVQEKTIDLAAYDGPTFGAFCTDRLWAKSKYAQEKHASGSTLQSDPRSNGL